MILVGRARKPGRAEEEGWGRERRMRENKMEKRRSGRRQGENKNLEYISRDKIRFDAVTNGPVSQSLQTTSVYFSLMIRIH